MPIDNEKVEELLRLDSERFDEVSEWSSEKNIRTIPGFLAAIQLFKQGDENLGKVQIKYLEGLFAIGFHVGREYQRGEEEAAHVDSRADLHS